MQKTKMNQIAHAVIVNMNPNRRSLLKLKLSQRRMPKPMIHQHHLSPAAQWKTPSRPLLKTLHKKKRRKSSLTKKSLKKKRSQMKRIQMKTKKRKNPKKKALKMMNLRKNHLTRNHPKK